MKFFLESQGRGYSKLHIAAKTGDLKKFKTVKQEYLAKGIDGLIWKDKAKETPLHIAAKFNHLDIVKQYSQYDDLMLNAVFHL